MESQEVTAAEKEELRLRKNDLDLAALLEKTQQLQSALIAMVHSRPT